MKCLSVCFFGSWLCNVAMYSQHEVSVSLVAGFVMLPWWIATPHSQKVCFTFSDSKFRTPRVDSRDPQTSNIPIWRYHCLGEVVFLKIWNQYWLPSDTGATEVFVHLPCPSSNLVYRSLESTLILHTLKIISFPNPPPPQALPLP